VLALAAVSLLTDVSSEMIAPLLPIFLSATLGASASAVGAIEGAAESTAALLKLASGWWSDRLPRRKPLVVAGYLLASVARPLVAVAGVRRRCWPCGSRIAWGRGSAPRHATRCWPPRSLRKCAAARSASTARPTISAR
jgi:MFS family permease